MQMCRRLRWFAAAGLAIVLGALPVAGQSNSVTIDDQPTTEQNLARINDLRRASRHDDAADLLQELIDGARFRLVSVDEGLYIDAELWAARELSRDPALLEAYRDRYSASAERALGIARVSGGLHGLREAYRRFAMTRPGLDAGLALSGALLERGDVEAASALMESLARHPDRFEAAARIDFLRGVCAALQGDAAFAASIAVRLRATDVELGDQLDTFRDSLSMPSGTAAGGLTDAGPAPLGLDAPLWDAQVGPATGARGRSAFNGLYALPVAWGERVLLNTGTQLLALDRASGQHQWAYPEETGQGPGFTMNTPTWLDTRGVELSGGRLFAVLGACRGVLGRGGAEMVPPNLLVCLDPDTGEVAWSRASGDIDEDEPTIGRGMRGLQSALLQTHFVGTPVSAQGRVFVFVRKTSQTGLTTTWLAAFDAHDGRLMWFRHLALVQVRHGQVSQRITPQLLLVGDTLYLTDQAAVAASIDVHSGAYRWLRVLADGRNRRANSLTLNSEGIHTPPVLTPSGLVLQLPLSDQHLHLLDPDSGRTLRTMEEDSRLRGAQYVLDADGHAVIVSRTSVLFWDGSLGEIRWVHTLATGAVPQGRGAVTREFVVIPTQWGSFVLRLSDGELIDERDTITGNITALDTEVLVSTNGALRSYMSWEGAYARLIQRVERAPKDDRPGLSLAFLAMDRGESEDTVIEGLGLALRAVEHMAGDEAIAARSRVFDAMRTMASTDSEAGDPLRSRLFNLMASSAFSPEQSAVYHIERGRHLVATGGYEQAVRHFQSVMVDPTLDATGYGELGSLAVSPAGATARHELLALIRENGREIYQRYDALAKQELEALLARGDEDPAALSQIAKRYPLALASSRALLIAAQRLEAGGEAIGALSQYQQAMASAMTTDQQQAAAGALLSYYERAGRPGDALSLIERLTHESAALDPKRAGESLPLRDWRALFVAMEGGLGPAIDPPDALGRPLVLDGRLLLPPPGSSPNALNGSLFVHTGADTVTRLDAAATELWSSPVPGRQLYILADDQGQVLVWSVDRQTLTALDRETGLPLWRGPADLAMLHDPEAADASRRVLPEDLPWVHVGPSVVCFVSRSGHVVGIDRYQGEHRWTVDTSIPRVTACAADPWTLVVAGVIGPEIDLNHGKIMLLDLYSGEPVLDRVDLHVGFAPQVVGLDGGRMVAVAESGTRVTLFDAATGETRWQQTLSDSDATNDGLAHGGTLAIADQIGMVYVARFGSERAVLTRLRLAQSGDGSPITIRPMGDGMLVFGPLGAAALNADGSVNWRDAPQTGEGALHQALAGPTRVALIGSLDATGDPYTLLAQGQAVRYRIDLLSRAGGRLEQTYTLGPIHGQLDPRRAAITQAGIALAMGPQTLLVPNAATAGSGNRDAADRR